MRATVTFDPDTEHFSLSWMRELGLCFDEVPNEAISLGASAFACSTGAIVPACTR